MNSSLINLSINLIKFAMEAIPIELAAALKDWHWLAVRNEGKSAKQPENLSKSNSGGVKTEVQAEGGVSGSDPGPRAKAWGCGR